jgi:hypothetical protein
MTREIKDKTNNSELKEIPNPYREAYQEFLRNPSSDYLSKIRQQSDLEQERILKWLKIKARGL